MTSAEIKLTEETGNPVLALVRMAAPEMGLWERAATLLERDFRLAFVELAPAVLLDPAEADPLARYADDLCASLAERGIDQFHLYGWTGGAQVALKCALRHAGAVRTVVSTGGLFEPAQSPMMTLAADVVRLVLREASLEFYTRYWIASGLTPDFYDRNTELIDTLVRRRLEADEGRLDGERVIHWIDAQLATTIAREEANRIGCPVLLLEPGFGVWPPLSVAHNLAAELPDAELAVVEGLGAMMLFEDPDAALAPAFDFWRRNDATGVRDANP
ncbi:alpha/beta hydrolase [Parasphingopyxis sp.]|uniref:alpha/beta fold hydrolase n=1 Tax=Parasphingopyxis sp. TaxID=1920299 RepID=UPI00260DCAB2|nr:alpha/beta hydrolase [Parasphingopyxis sp.]